MLEIRDATVSGLKYELMPSEEQQGAMLRFAGSCRFVYNKALALQNAKHKAGNKFISYNEMANLLPDWKYEFEWLGNRHRKLSSRRLRT